MIATLILAYSFKPEWAKTFNEKQLAAGNVIVVADNVSNIFSINEAEKFINEFNGDALILAGYGTEVSMAISPKPTLTAILVSTLSGTLSIKRERCYVIPESNNKLNLKITTSGQKNMMDLDDNKKVSMPAVILMEKSSGIESIDIKFTDLKDVKEFDMITYPDGVTLPKINPKCDGYKFSMKSRDITSDYGDGTGKKLMMGYYEIKPALSGGAIAGIVIACVAVVAGSVVGAVFTIRYRKSKIIK